MTWSRRQLLEALGIGSASTLLWATGCGAPAKRVRRTVTRDRDEVRAWLRDAVARLAATYPSVHALAVMHRRTTAALDVLGAGVARDRRDGVVLTVRDPAGAWREHVTTDLSADGVRAAVDALDATRPPARVALPPPPAVPPPHPRLDDDALRLRVDELMQADRGRSSRIVYAAALLDIDDVTVWSIAPGHDRELHTRRVLERATRAAWNGTHPVVSDAERGWSGDLGDAGLTPDEVQAASRRALHLMTPGAFADGPATVVLDPGVTATIIDAAVRGLMTTTAVRRPEVARRLALGTAIAAPVLELVDDPTEAGAYGGAAFDDTGEPAQPTTLLAAGRVAGRITGLRRAGHVGELVPTPSHLRLTAGKATIKELGTDGWRLEGEVDATFDPSSDRIVVGVARARELRNGSDTGRVYPDVELVGELGPLLADVTGLGADTATHVIRADVEGEPRWRSISAPWLRTRGLVRGRTRSA